MAAEKRKLASGKPDDAGDAPAGRYGPLADRDVMQRVQAGESEGFAELIRRYRAALVRVAEKRLVQRDWAEDAVQETFLSAFKSRHTYDGQFSFRTWLWTILLNQCRTLTGRLSRTPRVSPWADQEAHDEGTPAEQSLAEAAEPAPLARLLARERSELLDSLLARLTPAQAEALRLRFFEGLKFQEIANTMSCSLGTAKNRVRWGLMRMSELLAEVGAAATILDHAEWPAERRPAEENDDDV
jgi:RNA polymerase sigma-70 factor (ECF subfamily)